MTNEQGRWRVVSKKTGHVHYADLYLSPELDGSPMVDDHHELSGAEQLDEYVRYVKERHLEQWEADAVPIFWAVQSRQNNVFEAAPNQSSRYGTNNLLTYFEWPHDDEANKVDWYSLPVVFGRFPRFAEELGWVPGALQPTAPLRSIMASKRGATS
ncbi:hypothetical protein [Amycolatopsis granulosa]|uniref:hypothetical protein n=1 Tax=Amycolatopsis granulosa TaxID=185684 RepID=UPI00141EEBA3|nr:hypothetical protein [Amycolatopsis granulosa]NIH84698.1 hypothetical protein [Amycolatopsis granulosa]